MQGVGGSSPSAPTTDRRIGPENPDAVIEHDRLRSCAVSGTDELIERLRAARTAAMRERRTPEVAALRSALSAVANAEAVDASQAPSQDSEVIAGAVTGVGAGEVARRQLSETEIRSIVQAEADDHRRSAQEYDALDRPDQAAARRAGADAIEQAIAGAPG